MVGQTLSKMKTIGAVTASTTTTQDNQGMTRILRRLGFKQTSITYHMTIKRAKPIDRHRIKRAKPIDRHRMLEAYTCGRVNSSWP